MTQPRRCCHRPRRRPQRISPAACSSLVLISTTHPPPLRFAQFSPIQRTTNAERNSHFLISPIPPFSHFHTSTFSLFPISPFSYSHTPTLHSVWVMVMVWLWFSFGYLRFELWLREARRKSRPLGRRAGFPFARRNEREKTAPRPPRKCEISPFPFPDCRWRRAALARPRSSENPRFQISNLKMARGYGAGSVGWQGLGGMDGSEPRWTR